MKKIMVVLVSLSMAWGSWVFAESMPRMTGGATALARLLINTRSFQANFKQTTIVNGQRHVSEGRVYAKRPGRFRWDVVKPQPLLVVMNGNQVWQYDAGLMQAARYQVADKQATDPAQLLSGNVLQSLRDFSVQVIRGSHYPYLFQLTPRRHSKLLKQVLLGFDRHQLVFMQITNQLGQINQLSYSQVKVNESMDDQKLFHFTPEKGVDVISR